MRIRLNTERGEVVDFVVQFEASDPVQAGLHHEVVRYDGSHGRAHYHVFDRSGREIKMADLPAHLSYNEAVQVAIDDLDRNWKQYRAAFFGDEQ